MRRRGRECALQILYQHDIAGKGITPPSPTPDTAIINRVVESFFNNFEAVDVKTRDFAERLVHGVLKERTVLDEAIHQASQHWRLERMEIIDRNLLRLAAYEILYCPEIPPSATINEAVEIAKRFGNQESPKFIHGILDAVVHRNNP